MPDGRERVGKVVILKKEKPCPIIVVDKDVLRSKAWGSLSTAAPQVYLWFLMKRQMKKIGKKGHERKTCINDGKIVFTYAEAKKEYSITQPRFTRALDELINKGFIEITQSAGGLYKEVTLYGFSERWRKYGTPGFIEVRRSKRNQTVGFCKPQKSK